MPVVCDCAIANLDSVGDEHGPFPQIVKFPLTRSYVTFHAQCDAPTAPLRPKNGRSAGREKIESKVLPIRWQWREPGWLGGHAEQTLS
jgi:hypothetical protein